MFKFPLIRIEATQMGKIYQKEFCSDLKFRALDVEAEVVDCGVAEGEEDGVHREALYPDSPPPVDRDGEVTSQKKLSSNFENNFSRRVPC